MQTYWFRFNLTEAIPAALLQLGGWFADIFARNLFQRIGQAPALRARNHGEGDPSCSRLEEKEFKISGDQSQKS
jgi:hypothetical protein